jgi:CBS domain-containing protein
MAVHNHSLARRLEMGSKVRDVMTARPRCVTPDTPVSQVAELMEADDIGAIPVLEGDQLSGMVTDRDIVVRAIAKGKDPRGMPVREVSSRDVVSVGPDQDLSDALQLMAANQVRRLPVVDEDNRLVGVVSQADVALGAKEKAVGELVEEISKPPEGPRQASTA